VRIESDSAVPFLDVLFTKRDQHWPLRFAENLPTPAITLLWIEEPTSAVQQEHLVSEIDNLKCELQAQCLSPAVHWLTFEFQGRYLSRKWEMASWCCVYSLCKGHLQKFKRKGNCHNIGTVLKSKHSLRRSRVSTRLERTLQKTAHCIYTVPCECDRSCTAEIGRSLTRQLQEHRHNHRRGFLQTSKLAQHAYEEGHM
jgi:hypothetical protein